MSAMVAVYLSRALSMAGLLELADTCCLRQWLAGRGCWENSRHHSILRFRSGLQVDCPAGCGSAQAVESPSARSPHSIRLTFVVSGIGVTLCGLAGDRQAPLPRIGAGGVIQ